MWSHQFLFYFWYTIREYLGLIIALDIINVYNNNYSYDSNPYLFLEIVNRDNASVGDPDGRNVAPNITGKYF